MPPAARLTDPTAHGTPLAGAGSPDVLIDGTPAWRAFVDFHACPVSDPSTHGGGVVQGGSSSVLINGVPAARLGDTIVESGPPNAIVGGSSTVMIG